MTPKQLLGQAYANGTEILEQPTSWSGRLYQLCEYLTATIPHYDWVGFYLVDRSTPAPAMLVLGPYAGAATEHIRISFGTGVCGQAAAEARTLVVQDVGAEENYLACSTLVEAEIVTPLSAHGELLGVLDVDSHSKAPFTDADRQLLESLAEQAAAVVYVSRR